MYSLHAHQEINVSKVLAVFSKNELNINVVTSSEYFWNYSQLGRPVKIICEIILSVVVSKRNCEIF